MDTDNSRFFTDSNFFDTELNFSCADFANFVSSGLDWMFFLILFVTEFFFFSISKTAWVNFFSIEVRCFISFFISSIEETIEFNLYSRPCFSSGVLTKSISFSICSLFWISNFSFSWAADLSLWTLSSWVIFWLRIALILSAFCLKVWIRFSVDFRDEEYFLDIDLTFLYSFSPFLLILLISDFCEFNCFSLFFNPIIR